MPLLDPFSILGLPRRYDLDAAQVEQFYLARVADLHPDLIASESLAALGEDGLDAERRSSELNEARQILSDPEQRALALWRLHGGGGVGGDDKSLAPAFLMEMMTIREEMEASPEDRPRWDTWTRDHRAAHQKKVADLFRTLEAGGPAPALLKQIRLELNAWRYIERMAEQIR